MVEGTTPQSDPTSEELHRGLSQLRGDIQDLRTQVASLHHRIDETNRSLSGRIDDARRRSPSDRIDESIRTLSGQIQELNKRVQTSFRWTMATLVAMTGILIAVIKL